MKMKKSILIVVLTYLMIALLSTISVVQATTISKTYTIQANRNGKTYQLANSAKTIWKIVDARNNVGQSIYCLRGGQGFGSFENTIQETTYLNEFDMFDLTELNRAANASYRNELPTDNATYQKLLWVLDHCYTPKKTNASDAGEAEYRQILLEEAEKFVFANHSELRRDFDITLLTDEDIDVVQQLAIWYFTNPSGDYHIDDTFELYINGRPLSDIDWDRADTCQGLFYYFVESAEENYQNVSTVTGKPVQFSSTNVSIQTQGNRIVVGPYRLQENTKVSYSLTGTVTDGSGNVTTITNANLLDANQNAVAEGTTLKDMVGQNFYISLPSTVNTSKITVSIHGNYFGTTAKYMAVGQSALAANQPIVLLEKAKVPYDDSKEFVPEQPEKPFDLALRKYITKLNGLPVTNTRTPNIDLAGLASGTTAIYKHRKDPLLVQNGNVVTYNLTVYNEGEKAGRATKIVDQLPTGLTLKTTGTVTSTKGNVYTIQYDEANNKVTLTTTGTNNLNAYNGTTLDSDTITLECTVTVNNTSNSQVLTNVAWIAEEYDAEYDHGTGRTITTVVGQDRDSEPGTVPNVNKDNMENYAGNGNKTDLTDSNYYYKGWQDDDDFEKLIIEGKYFDLSLRKFISDVYHNDSIASFDFYSEGEIMIREPKVDITPLKNGSSTTAIYRHIKTPVPVEIGDTVTYTIRVYNEGQIDGYVTEITDHLPPQLEFLANDTLNLKYGWKASSDGRTIKTDITSPNTENKTNQNEIYAQRENGVLLKAFETGDNLNYIDLQIRCKVKTNIDITQKITNIAEITGFTDKDGNTVTDRDSQKSNVTLPTDDTLPNYKDTEINRSDSYIPGQQDDDDFEKLVLKQFDLSLRKFITTVIHNGTTKNYDRAPVVDVTPLRDRYETTAIYNHPKTPVGVDLGDEVIYTIRVYNEGQVNGYVTEITDHLPEQLEFMVNDELNAKYGWKVSQDGRTITTDITSPNTTNSANRDTIYTNRTLNNEELLINRTSDNDKVLLTDYCNVYGRGGDELNYIDVQVKCKVKQNSNLYEKITNIAEITGFTDSNGNQVTDRDSQAKNVTLPNDKDLPSYKDTEIERGDNYIPGQQDDDDFEKLVLQRFDLALRKFITGVNDKEISSRAPVFKKISDTEYKYEHTKEPVEVANGNTVIYTLRIFNEGNVSGYATKVKDNLPQGIVFLPDNEVNKTYRWKMYQADGTETNDVTKATYIETDYLSKEQEKEAGKNLIKAFNPQTMTMPDYKDIKIAFKVTEPNTSDRIIINTAEISDDSDEKGNPIDDIDSTPNNNKDGEDDIDIEKIKVKFFDLSLRKWVTESIVTYDGKTTVTKTGNKAEDDPETPAKVEIRGSRIDKTTVKFKFNIKVTNEGEIEGYAKEIKDYIPEGLKFDAKDNPQWKTTSKANEVVTDQLKDKLLKPGESATISITLTWINNKNNMGQKVNWAEISKDENEYNSPDIDSTPNNNKKGEDDIDEAPVILSIVTGDAPTYITLVLASLSILTAGVIFIKKFVM